MLANASLDIFMHDNIRAEMKFARHQSIGPVMVDGLRDLMTATRAVAHSKLFDLGIEHSVLAVPRELEETVCSSSLPKYAILLSDDREAVVFLYERQLQNQGVLLAVVGSGSVLLANLMSSMIHDDSAKWSEHYGTMPVDAHHLHTLFAGAGIVSAAGATSNNGKLTIRSNDGGAKKSHSAYVLDAFEEEYSARHRVETQDPWVREARVSSHLVFFEGQGHSETVYARKLTPEMRRLAPWMLTASAAELGHGPVDLGLDAPVYIETSGLRREQTRVGRIPKHIAVIMHEGREAAVLLTPVQHHETGKAYLASVLSGHEVRRELALRCREDFSKEHGAVRGEARFGDSTIYGDRDKELAYIGFAMGGCAVQYHEAPTTGAGLEKYIRTLPRWLLDAYVANPKLLSVRCEALALVE